jgi:low affinity Fe/Cu permease
MNGSSTKLAMAEKFRAFAWAFSIAVVIVAIWLITGPIFHFSDARQLVIDTGTTIVTFLMVFLIQAAPTRDAIAVHLKLDELIRSTKARNVFADLEDATKEEIAAFKTNFPSCAGAAWMSPR